MTTLMSKQPYQQQRPLNSLELRHYLHQYPELSGQEINTARCIHDHLVNLQPDELISGIGGHSLAAVYHGARSGPTVMIRGDMDALPIQELGGCSYQSQVAGVAHMCGHDGHSAILAELAAKLQQHRPDTGRAILLFQAAEETGEGARAVLADPRFAELSPDWVYGLHNLPGIPLGHLAIKEGAFACASSGITIELSGCTSHAARPEHGVSPAQALADLISALTALPQHRALSHSFSLVTVVYAELGTPTFGTAPGSATLMATLRADNNESMDKLKKLALAAIEKRSQDHQLNWRFNWQDSFSATFNHKEAVSEIYTAASNRAIPIVKLPEANRWSEDFGEFTQRYRGAFFGLGAGKKSPELHNPDYDFPDQLIEDGAGIFFQLIEQHLSENR